jgi:hypothetical protein
MAKYKRKIKRKKYSLAGMYDPNQVPAGIGAGSTGHIVMEESDPTLQQEREDQAADQASKLTTEANEAASALKLQEQKDKQAVEANAANLKTRFGVGEQVLSQGLKLGMSQFGQQAGTQAGKLVGQQAMKRAIGRQSQKQVARIAKRQAAKGVAKTGAKVGGKAAQASNPFGWIGLAGQATSMLSDDKDATKWNTGEVIGDVTSSAATGAQLGSMILPGVGTAIGGIAGGLYGIGKGLVQRNRARKDKAEATGRREQGVRNVNEGVMGRFKSAWARAAAGRYKSKTYSGSDTGRVMPGIG